MSDNIPPCSCPSGLGGLQWPCPAHPPELDVEQQTAAQVAALAQQTNRRLDLAATLEERERFEAQMLAEGVTNFTRRPSGRYDHMVLEWIWLGWRGRARAGAPS